jgi:hypothetical protein
MRLRQFRIYTETPWAIISEETGLSGRTLRYCENGKLSASSREKLSAYLDKKESTTRRWQNLNDPEGKLEYYIDHLWPTGKPGTIVNFLDNPYLIMEPPTQLYLGAPVNGAIYMPDDRLEPTFLKNALTGLCWIKNKFMWVDHCYLIIDSFWQMYMGKVYPCLPNTTLELRPNNAKYPSYYIHEPNIKAVFALQKGNAENQQKV